MLFRRKWKMTYIPKWKHSLWVPQNLGASYILTYKMLPLCSASCFIQKGKGIRADNAHNFSPFYFLSYIFSHLLPSKTHHGAPETILTSLKPQAINRPSSLLSLISLLQQIPLCLFSPRNMVNILHPKKTSQFYFSPSYLPVSLNVLPSLFTSHSYFTWLPLMLAFIQLLISPLDIYIYSHGFTYYL